MLKKWPKKPVKVFILAGQSNMEGKGFPEPLAYQVSQEKYQRRYTHFIQDGDYAAFTRLHAESKKSDERNPVYRWSVRDDVWVNYLDRRGNLTVGFAAPDKAFGPEYNFGHVMGDHFEEQVLLIKTAWGGKALGRSFLPPSAPLPTAEEFEEMAAAQNEGLKKRNARDAEKMREQNEQDGKQRVFTPQPLVTVADVRQPYGHYYREMIREVRDTLAEIKLRFPAYRGQGVELAGFVWFQGWNDRVDPVKAAAYEAHMKWFIKDVRKDLEAPSLPFVIGAIGFDGPKQKQDDGVLLGQRAMAEVPEFSGNLAVVETAPFWDLEADAIYNGPGSWKADVEKWRQFGNERPYHYLGSPWFFTQAGTAFGDAMKGLLVASTIEFDLNQLNEQGLRGPANGQTSLAYEFKIPNTDQHKAEVKAIDASVRFMAGSRGRIGAGKG